MLGAGFVGGDEGQVDFGLRGRGKLNLGFFGFFLQALQRGGRLISLLSQNKDLVALVALVLGAAPRLSDMLARQPQIMDGLIDPRFFGTAQEIAVQWWGRHVTGASDEPGREDSPRNRPRTTVP